MTPTQTVQLKQSKARERLGELVKIETRSDEEQTEMVKLTDETLPGLEVELRAAIALEDQSGQKTADPSAGLPITGEDPKRVELRNAASLAEFVKSSLTGRSLVGAEAELAAEINLTTGAIPLEMLEARAQAVEHRADAPTPAPSTVGVNMAGIVPSIFARSIAPRMGVQMPRVGTGTYAIPRISTSLTASAKAKGDAQESTAAALTVTTTTPHRVTARLTMAIEDIAAVGTESFEAAFRQNLMLVLSDKLDQFALRTGSGAQPTGLLNGLTDPADPTEVTDWAGFVAAIADGIDGGPWAEDMTAVMLLVNADTMKLSEKTFRTYETIGTGGGANAYVDRAGETSAAAYLREHSGGFMASSRMPATASNIAQAIRYRPGTMGIDGVDAVMTAVCPVWNELAVDDPYTDAASGERHLTIHALVGDVIRTQPDAYERVDLKVA